MWTTMKKDVFFCFCVKKDIEFIEKDDYGTCPSCRGGEGVQEGRGAIKII